MVQFTQEHRLEFQATPRLFIKPRILDGNSGFVSKCDHQLHLLWTEQMTMTAINTDAAKHLLPGLQRHAQHRVNLSRDHRIIAQKAGLVFLKTVHRHTRPSSLHASPGTTLTYANLDT